MTEETQETTAVVDPKLAEVIAQQSEILLTAYDLGLEISDELKAEITDIKQGKSVIKKLDALVRGAVPAKPDNTAEKVVATGGEEEHTEQKPPARKSAAKKPTGETTVTQATKKTAGTKKTPTTKKVAKKAVKTAAKKAAAPAKENARKPVQKFDPAAKISWIAEKNPCREGSGRYDRYEILRKANGKTVKWALDQGLPQATIIHAIDLKVISVK